MNYLCTELNMKTSISFSVPGSSVISKLQLGATLISFTGYDFTYFGEQCAEAVQKYLKTGENVMEKAMAYKEYIRNCHPYCSALINTEFDKVVIDCIIDYLCTKYGTGLEELWVKYLSAKDAFGQEIFRRITEYKTGLAINQWTNLLRMQIYAASKASVIYGGEETDCSVHKARKLYYDMAFRLAAREVGFDLYELPGIKRSSIPYIPEAATMMKNAVNTIEPMIKAMAKGYSAKPTIKGRDSVRDQAAGLTLNIMMGLKRPETSEIAQFISMYGDLPDEVFEPMGMKAVIDLEFDKLMENGLFLKPGSDGSYSLTSYSGKDSQHSMKREIKQNDEPVPEETTKIAAVPEFTPTPSKRKQSRKRAAPRPEFNKEAVILPEPVEIPKKGVQTEKMNDKVPPAAEATDITSNVKRIIEIAEDQNRELSKVRTLQEVNTRCNLIWTSMNVRTGWSISAEESSQWFRYLTKLRYGIGTGELTPAALDRFLDATLEVYKLLPAED
jgi:hypothetical protein